MGAWSVKVAFIQAGSDHDADFSAPLWPAYLRAYASQYVDAEWIAIERPGDIAAVKPDVLAVSSMSQDWPEAKRIIQIGNWFGARVIVGGHHVTSVLDPGNEEYETVIGPGEAAFTAKLTGQPMQQPNKLDDIPEPDHSFGRRPGHKPSLITSRGCAYNCSFCSPKLMWDKIRFHSPPRVVSEIKQIMAEYPGIRRISIWDDLFAANKRRVRDIAALLKDDGISMGFNTGMRAELVTDESCLLWKSMGLTRIGIGGESAVPRILGDLKGETASVQRNQRAIGIASGHGMAVGTGIIFGSPSETEADVLTTYNWLLENYRKGKLMSHSINILTPLPGTPVWHKAVETGHVSNGPEFDLGRLKCISMTARTDGKYRGRRGWMQQRRDIDAIYLNEDVLPQETLYEIIDHYEKKIAMCSPAQIVRGIRRKVEPLVRMVL